MSRFSYGWRAAKRKKRLYAIQAFVKMFKLEQKQTTGLVSPMVSGVYNS